MYYIQSRWKLEGRKLCYYGLRSGENMFRNSVPVSKRQAGILSALPKELTEDERICIASLLGVQVVCESELKRIPKSLSEATFCKGCCANDYIIPGLEFDSDGYCPFCQTAEETKNLRSVLPVIEDIPRSKKSRFDAALFYTGGKDSTFLLYYLSKVKGLRVLALTWEIPFMTESARASIENAKKKFDNVEFISHTVNKNDLTRFYTELYSLSENTCACPSLAYLLFYPTLVENRVPYFLAGNEPAQMLGLYYNHIAPKIAYSFAENKFLTFLFNAGRILILHPPLKQGQFQTLITMKQLAYGDNPFKKLSGYSNELVSNVVRAIKAVPELLPPVKRSIQRSSWSGNIPAFVHLDFDRILGESYDWNKTRDILIKQCGWIPPDNDKKALHTSCKLERCKDCSQFMRFYQCRSRLIPFSAIEISLASRSCGRSREEIMYEMENLLGFSLEELPEYSLMREYIDETGEKS